MVKILVVRFSSIGDVVLTTSVVRALKKQLKDSEIHFLTKSSFKGIVEFNPNISKIYSIESSVSEIITELKKEHYDYIIDLHRNTRTAILKYQLGRPSFSFPKLNFKKWLLVNFKNRSMPKEHVVDRYFKAVLKLGIKNDQLPCDFYIHPNSEVEIHKSLGLTPNTYITIAIGAQFLTKRMPFNILKEIAERIEFPIVLVGGEMDIELAAKIKTALPDKEIVSVCGKFSLPQSASIVKQSKLLLSNDTGMMHIASCFETPTVSVWGNTVPELGMYPYFPKHPELFSIHEVDSLKCRPCSKIGFQKCPKGHFKCMNLQDTAAISADIMHRAK